MVKKQKFAAYLTLQTSQETRIGERISLLSDSTFPVEAKGGLIHSKETKKE